jgi:hypothetical protein
MTRLDHGQRESELSKALFLLIVAVSRYGNDDEQAQPTPARLAVIAQIAALVADEVAARIGRLQGREAERKFRTRLARGAPNTSAE